MHLRFALPRGMRSLSSGARLSMAIAASAAPTTVQRGPYVSREVDGAVIDLGVGQPSPSSLPLEALAAAAAHRLGSADSQLLLQYGPRSGYRSFRCALAAFLSSRYGVHVEAEHLVVTAGVSHGLDLAAGALAAPGSLLGIECPTYFLVPPIFADNHLRLHQLPTDEEGLAVEQLAAWLEADAGNRPALVYTVPIHSNPRGAVLPPGRRRQLLRLAHRYGFYVLADEVYQVLSFPGERHAAAHDEQGHEQGHEQCHAAAAGAAHSSSSPPPPHPPTPPPCPLPLPLPLRAYEECPPEQSRVVSLGSFSKMLAPALRLGWVECSNPAVLSALRGNGVLSSGGCIAQLSCGIAHSALELGLQAEHLDAVVRPGLAARCAALTAALRTHLPPGCALATPRGGYFVWVTLPETVDSRALLARAEARHGVRFTPGPACGGGPPHCLRTAFSFYSPEELEEGAARLGAAVAEALAAAQGAGETGGGGG